MKAAMRVNNPTRISRPVTNSISPANHIGQVPTGTEVPSGQPNSFIDPCSANSSPKMMRNALSTGEE